MNQQTKTILIVDDNPENIKLIADVLQVEGVKLAYAQSGAQALQRLKKASYDLILMDVIMPQLDGYETVIKIRKVPAYAQVPIIFLTAIENESSLEKAFSVGGADFIRKPFRPRELIARVHYHLERKDLMDQLEYMASKDMLTNIYNRRKFFELATALFEQNTQSLLGVLIDIDHFKAVNDRYGHQAGDRVLQQVASTIQKNLPEGTILGRIGGEEFAIVFEGESLISATQQIEGIRKAVEAARIEIDGGESLHCTISVGLNEKHEGVNNIDDLLQGADKALYGAKHAGRNRLLVRARTC